MSAAYICEDRHECGSDQNNVKPRAHNPMNGRFEKLITEKEVVLAVKRCNGMGTGDIANDMGFAITGVRNALKAAELRGLIRRTIINKRIALWWVALCA